jgi:hypothetical protein
VSFKREQIPCSPAFALTDYRVQGQTYDEITVDLVSGFKGTGHKTFAAVYVALSRCRCRCRSLNGLQFARLFDERIFRSAPSSLLKQEMQRLNNLCTADMGAAEVLALLKLFESGVDIGDEKRKRFLRWDAQLA